MIFDLTTNSSEQRMGREYRREALISCLEDPIQKAQLLNMVHRSCERDIYEWIVFFFKRYNEAKDETERLKIVDLVLKA